VGNGSKAQLRPRPQVRGSPCAGWRPVLCESSRQFGRSEPVRGTPSNSTVCASGGVGNTQAIIRKRLVSYVAAVGSLRGRRNRPSPRRTLERCHRRNLKRSKFPFYPSRNTLGPMLGRFAPDFNGRHFVLTSGSAVETPIS
jgi:hypothetical protein